MDHDKCPVCVSVKKEKVKAWFQAAKHCDQKKIEVLLTKNIDVNQRIWEQGRTFPMSALDYVIEVGDEQCAKILLSKGADPIGKSFAVIGAGCPLFLAASKNHTRCVDLLLSKCLEDISDKTFVAIAASLNIAAGSGHEGILKKLIDVHKSLDTQELADISWPTTRPAFCDVESRFNTALELALLSASTGNNVKCVKILLDSGMKLQLILEELPSIVQQLDTYCRPRVEYLAQALPIKAHDREKYRILLSAFCTAAYQGHLDIIHLLVEAGMSIDGGKDGDNEYIPIHSVITRECITRNMKLIPRWYKMIYPEEHSEADNMMARTIQELIYLGVDVTKKAVSSDHTPLDLAAGHGYYKVTCLLLESLTNVDAYYLCRPLMYSAIRGYANIVEILIRHGAQPNLRVPEYDDLTCLFIMLREIFNSDVREEHYTVLKTLIRGGYDLTNPTDNEVILQLAMLRGMGDRISDIFVASGVGIKFSGSEDKVYSHQCLCSLKFISRRIIIDCLHKNKKLQSINSLPLPTFLKNYLHFSELSLL